MFKTWPFEVKAEEPAVPDIGVIYGLYWDNGKDNGNYYNGESNGKKMEMKWKLGCSFES